MPNAIEIDVHELKKLLDAASSTLVGAAGPTPAGAAVSSPSPLLLDVRRPDEHEIAAFPGATLIPLHELMARIDELDPARATVVYCHHGIRSLQAAMVMRSKGFTNVRSLAGGIDRWSTAVDPSMPRY